MAEMEKSTFLRCTKNDFSASATVHRFRELKDYGNSRWRRPRMSLDQEYDWLVFGGKPPSIYRAEDDVSGNFAESRRQGTQHGNRLEWSAVDTTLVNT